MSNYANLRVGEVKLYEPYDGIYKEMHKGTVTLDSDVSTGIMWVKLEAYDGSPSLSAVIRLDDWKELVADFDKSVAMWEERYAKARREQFKDHIEIEGVNDDGGHRVHRTGLD